ncbi:hypothetical protein FVF58_49580 [Paraburkholderia panacisoli]|uniref:Uncharacterized protein n=1 Tax=Paraburkholderia panacisoli TaxID=2603818 RepID=A0A5B0G1F2_9BURK|nr:hypothetical protein [Paraburkholderia panacisoli]KAA0997407.1 hypothetical protein FVF58_49580 [Paraburkholderia panacisoli]
MKRIYTYKGFEVAVELERSGDEGVWLLRPHGFVSVVRIRSAGAIGGTFAPISLMADGQRPFGTEAEAFMAGYSAAQRLIDDTVVL